MAKRRTLSDSDVLGAIDNYHRQTGAPPTVAQARDVIDGPVGNGRICRLLRESKQRVLGEDAL
ncbi:hypothetical protein [Palleronia sp.]|uniref:hypothetical protein n=1 Tax=Palleronia sp. TaxID=1940284 RepID=UPI0035C79687